MTEVEQLLKDQLAEARAERDAFERQMSDAVVLAMSRASAESFYAEVAARKKAESQLTEARALLEDVRRDLHSKQWNDRYDAFLAANPEPPSAAIYHMVGCDARDDLTCTHDCENHRYGEPPRAAAERAALSSARDGLREMFKRWHVTGPHATHDAPVIEQAILALDVELTERAEPAPVDDLCTVLHGVFYRVNRSHVVEGLGMTDETSEIHTYAHCKQCFLRGQTQRLEAGLTTAGIRIDCKKHGLVCHFTPGELTNQIALGPRCNCCPGGMHRS